VSGASGLSRLIESYPNGTDFIFAIRPQAPLYNPFATSNANNGKPEAFGNARGPKPTFSKSATHRAHHNAITIESTGCILIKQFTSLRHSFRSSTARISFTQAQEME